MSLILRIFHSLNRGDDGSLKSENDIIEMWHVDHVVAFNVFMVFAEVLFGGSEACENDPDEYCDDNFVEEETSDSESD